MILNIKKIIEAESDEYVCVSDLADEKLMRTFFSRIVKNDPHFENSEETLDYLLETIEHIYIKFPENESLIDLYENESLIDLYEPENIHKKIEENIYEKIIEHADEQFPILIDVFQIQDVVFAYEVIDKEKSLEEIMNSLVEEERYEEAARIRDILKDIGSNKVKSK